MSEPIPLFAGEATLLSWGDTSARGKTVTFMLQEDDCGQRHPFRDLGTGKHGQRFRLIAQPIGDDEQPLPSGALIPGSAGHRGAADAVGASPLNKPTAAPDGTKGGWYALKPSARAALLCKDASFRAWAEERYDCPLDTEDDADHLIKAQVGTHKKAWLNPDHEQHRPAALKKLQDIERQYRVTKGLETAENA